jgi:hypothetical protein
MHAPNLNEGYINKIFQFGSSIRVLIIQPNGHITICVDPQNFRPISGSIDNLRTSKWMPPIQIKDTLAKKIQFGSSIRVSIIQPNVQLIISVDTQSYRPISDSNDNLKTSKCMPPIQMKNTLTRFFNLGT